MAERFCERNPICRECLDKIESICVHELTALLLSSTSSAEERAREEERERCVAAVRGCFFTEDMSPNDARGAACAAIRKGFPK